jgi:hypothetical protein
MKILQGIDYPVIIELINSEDLPLKPSDLYDFNIIVYTAINEQKSPKIIFKKADIEVVNNSLGEVKIIIPRTYTANAPTVKHYIEFKFKTDADSDFLDAKRADGVTDNLIGTVISSARGAL